MDKKGKKYATPELRVCRVAVIAGFGASNPSPWDEVETGEAGGEISTGSEWNL